MTFYYKEFFSDKIVQEYTEQGLTVDGTKGGLLLGQPHSNDGIPVLMRYSDGYRLIAEFEGDEYFLNPGATQYFEKDLIVLNDSDKDELLNLTLQSDLSKVTTINCFTDSEFFKSKFILTDARGSQYIINKHSTKRHLHRLEEMNKKVGWEFKGNPFDWVEPDLTTQNDTKHKSLISLHKLLRFFKK